MENQNVQGTPPKTWLVESILATILCCFPFGIVGIINAAKVESKFFAGAVDESLKASQEAAKWTKVAFFVGLGVYALYLILWLVVGVGFLTTAGAGSF